MKIYIDLKKINDAPIDKNDISNEMFKDETLVNELIHGNPTTYLVSGYRGVGKTSYILLTEKKLKARDKMKDKR